MYATCKRVGTFENGPCCRGENSSVATAEGNYKTIINDRIEVREMLRWEKKNEWEKGRGNKIKSKP